MLCKWSGLTVPTWLAEFRKHIPDVKVPIALAGNKKDLEDERIVSTEDARTLATANDMIYYETSAKLGGTEIEDIFRGLTLKALASKGSAD